MYNIWFLKSVTGNCMLITCKKEHTAVNSLLNVDECMSMLSVYFNVKSI